MSMGKQVWPATALVGLLAVSGCSVREQKGSGGEDKDVQIRVPFGGLQVRKDADVAARLGLPVYPGAVLSAGDGDNDKSVDVQMGFAAFQLRVQVANYRTNDPQPKVEDYYRKALLRYGAVLRCRGNEPIGEPTRTEAGLTCSDDGAGKHVHASNNGSADLELKAGSAQRQHIVAFKAGEGSGTRFSLIALLLPEGKSAAKADREE